MDYTPGPGATVTDYYPDAFSSPCAGDVVSRDSTALLSVFYCVLFVLGLLGNGLVILVLTVCKQLRSITDIFLLNLALSDLLFVASLPFLAHYQLDQWVFGAAMCKLVSGAYYVGFFSSMFFVTLMSVDRYLAVVHAAYAMKVRTARLGTGLSVGVWLVTVAAALPLLVFYQVSPEDGTLMCYSFYNQQTLRWKIFTHLEMNVLGLLVPFGILVFCYVSILHQLRRCQNQHRTKAVKLVLLVVAASLVFWVPFNAVLLLTTLHDLHVLDGCALSHRLIEATHVTETISFAHCCVNPVIYAFVGERFKKHLADVLRKVGGHVCRCLGRPLPGEGWERRLSAHQRASRSSSMDYVL